MNSRSQHSLVKFLNIESCYSLSHVSIDWSRVSIIMYVLCYLLLYIYTHVTITKSPLGYPIHNAHQSIVYFQGSRIEPYWIVAQDVNSMMVNKHGANILVNKYMSIYRYRYMSNMFVIHFTLFWGETRYISFYTIKVESS